MSKPIGVGIIGYGNSARTFHLPYILPNTKSYKLVAFLQRAAAPAKGSTPAKPHCTLDYPEARHYRDLDGFLGDKEVELVCVLTGHDQHFPLGKAALEAGKHVVIEKPFVTSSKEVEELMAIQKRTGKVLTGFQNRRYDADFLTLKKLLDTQALGQLTDCIMGYDFNDAPWVMNDFSKDASPGGGMAFGLGSHTMDQAMVLFGPPKYITGFFRSLRHPGQGFTSQKEDTFDIVLDYGVEGNNLLVTVKTSVVSRLVDDLKWFARGYNGTFVKFGVDQQEPQIQKGMKSTDSDFAKEPERMYGTLTTTTQIHPGQTEDKAAHLWTGTYPSLKGDYMGYYEDVARAIRGEIKVYVHPEQVRNSLRCLELARESSDKGARVAFDAMKV